MSASAYLENKLLEGTLAGNTYTAPGNVYAALFSDVLDDTVTGTEVTGNGYSRQDVDWSITDNIADSSGNVTFSCTGNAWGTIQGFAIMDANTSGNALYWQNLSPAITVDVDESITFTTGNIRVTAT